VERQKLMLQQMMNPVSSPGDPLFYMHHTWLDRIWAKWQDLKPSVRLTEIGGNNKAANPFAGPGNGTFPFPGGNGSFPFPGGNGSFPFPGGNGTTFPFPGGNGSFPFPMPGNGTMLPNGTDMGLTRPADVP
jgi:tyrosinase